MTSPAPDPWAEVVMAAVRDRRASDTAPHSIDLARGVLDLFAGAEGLTQEVDTLLRNARAVLAVAGVRP